VDRILKDAKLADLPMEQPGLLVLLLFTGTCLRRPRRGRSSAQAERPRIHQPPHTLAVTLKRKLRGWPGEMLLLPSAEAQ
jgi:hypothetical protein